MNLADSTVLVTGATRGIGRALTQQLIGQGASVVAVARDRTRLDALVAEHGDRISPWVVDLADPDAVDRFVSEVTDRHPTLSMVVNNAGEQTPTDFFGDDALSVRQAWRREVAVNLDAVITLSTGLLPHLRRQQSAAIVNITTGLALAPKRTAPVYCATKAAVRTFTRALRYQCQDSAPHIRVIDVLMALVDTDMTHGRGRNKISADAAAAAIVDAVRRGRPEYLVGQVKLLRTLMRLAPTVGYRLLRDS